MNPVVQSTLVAFGLTAIIIAAATALAFIAIKPAKAFAACAHLSREEKEIVFPSFLSSAFIYLWFASVIFPVIASMNSGYVQDILIRLSSVSTLFLLLLPLVYIGVWIRAMKRLHSDLDIRRGLPFFIGGAAVIEIVLLVYLGRSIST